MVDSSAHGTRVVVTAFGDEVRLRDGPSLTSWLPRRGRHRSDFLLDDVRGEAQVRAWFGGVDAAVTRAWIGSGRENGAWPSPPAVERAPDAASSGPRTGW